jgi:hypothetical protein
MKKQRKQWEMEHQAALDAMGADGLLDDRNSFAMVCTFFSRSGLLNLASDVLRPLPLTHAAAVRICRFKHPNERNKCCMHCTSCASDGKIRFAGRASERVV